jgi:hydrogenase nickel incorporation protein HypB
MRIQVVKSVLKAGEVQASTNRKRLDEADVVAINVMSAPGSGKTTLLEKTMSRLGADHPCAVLVGDLQTSRDAERLSHHAGQTVQINTGKGCHLTPGQTSEGLNRLDLKEFTLLFIENVGNMVCPAAFDLGEHARAVLLSLPEGDDKVAKYPTLFQQADVVVVTKIDLLEVLEFDLDRVYDDLARLNTRTPVIQISARTGQGMDKWLDWLRSLRQTQSP